MDAQEALRIGLCDEVVAPEQLHERAFALAAELAKGAVLAQALAKRAVDVGLDRELAGGLALERELFVEVFRTEDSQIGVKSFLEQGPGKPSSPGSSRRSATARWRRTAPARRTMPGCRPSPRWSP